MSLRDSTKNGAEVFALLSALYSTQKLRRITSVDDSPASLGKTKSFMRNHIEGASVRCVIKFF